MYKKNRNRGIYILFIIIVIALGLSSRKYGQQLPMIISTYAGDTLWGLMIFLIMAFIFKNKRGLCVAAIAMLAASAIEVSQLYQAQWINDIRNTALGGLILGYGFLWSDIICYFTGISMGLILDYVVCKKPRKKYYF